MNPEAGSHVPPLGYHWLTRAYDPIVRLTTREGKVKHALLGQLAPRPEDRILDLGCGTATFTIALVQSYPRALVVGLDADARALAIARGKARRAGFLLRLEQGSALKMPFTNATFDRVVSSLFFHHLTTTEKSVALGEIRRVLEPDGELHIADWGTPSNPLMRCAFLAVQLLDGFDTTRDSVNGALPELLRQAGFGRVEETACFDTPLGTIRLLRASVTL